MRIRDLRKRRAVCAVLFTLLLSAVGLTNATAQSFTVGNLNYSLNEDGASVTVTGHVDGQNASGELVIPESVELYGTTYLVTTIGDNAFYYCSGFTGSLIIPNSVTTIGVSAFYSTSFTGSLTIPESVTTISDYAFYYCSGFTGSLTLSNSVTAIGAYAFYGTGFTTVNFNATNCAQIGTEGYDDNWNWGWLSPFYNCSITTLNIGENVQSIPNRAFSGISSLTGDLTIPETVTIIGDRAFENTGFSSVNFNATNCTYMGSNNDLVFANCNNLTTLNIGENVEVIPSYAFKECSGLNGLLVIPETVTTIGDRAFENTGFSSVNFNATNCTYMGSNNDLVFTNCNNLTTLNIGENVEVIPFYAFKGCSGLTGSLVIPESVSYIRGRAFENTGFTTVNFNATNCAQMGGEGYDDNWNWVWFSPFYNCSITTLNIGENVQSIPYRAFSGISSLTGELTVPESIAYIGDRVFESTGFTTVNFNATNCNYMGSYYDPVFADCNNLTTLNLGENVEMIPSYAFYNCGGFTGSINLPNVLTTIGEGAFQNCTGFTGSLVIPDNVTVIGQHAFRECSGLDGTLAIGNSVTEIGSNAFYHCYGLSGELTIPNSVQTIGIGVFIDCAFTGTLTIGAGVTSINNAAFRRLNINEVHWNAVNCTFAGDNYWEAAIFAECNALTTLVFDGAVETIPDGTFFGLNRLLGELHIPNSVTTIGYESFYGCSGFTGSLQIPNSVTSIGSYAFCGCTGIEGDLIIGSSVEVIGEGAFSSMGITTLNYNAVNCQFGYCYNSYNDYWDGEYSAISNCPNLTILNIGEGVESLSNCAFRDITTLTGTLTLPNSLKSIGDQAFYNCYGLEGIVMGNSVETIGNEAFRNCGGLRGELTLPETLQSVGIYAFASCDELNTINYNAINCTEMGNAQSPVFYDCASLEHINIGENVGSIPNYAFKRCSTVVDMTVAAVAPPTIEASTFGTVSRAIPVNVPFGSGDDYRSAQYWEEFFNIVEGIGQNPYTCHWNANANQFAHNMTAIGIIQIDGVEQTTDALEIGAFCGNECRGSQMLAYYSQVNRYLVFLTLYGDPGDLLTFKLYDHELGEESVLGCTSIVTFEPDGILGTYNNPYVFNFTTVQNTALNEGWSWYSSFVELGNNSLQTMEESLGENGVMIKSQSNGFVINDLGSWMGSLHAVNNESMYLINTSAPCVLSMTGNFAVPSQHTIPLLSGWTWIGYPSAKTVDVNEALVNLNATDGDIIKARNCFAIYAEGNGWFGTLHTLSPGMGFMYHSLSTQSQSFVYGEGSRGVELRENLTAEHNHFVPNVAAYPYNMNVLAVVNLDGEELSSENYELAAFANGECRGSAKLMYVAPMNRYVAFLTVVGNDATTLSFGLYDVANGTVCYDTDDVMIYSNNAIVGSIDEPYVINFRETTGANEFANRINVYPNPVARGEMLNIGMAAEDLGQARVEIVNTLGMTVSSVYAPSVQTIAVPQTAGVYLLRVTMEGKGTYSQKIVVR